MLQVPDGCVDVLLKKERYYNELDDRIGVGDAHIYTSDCIDLGPREWVLRKADILDSERHAQNAIDLDFLTEY